MRSRGRRGFTLVELMIAVVIMGTLATLAVYGVRGAIRKSHLHEPIRMVGAIKAAQEAYRSETGVYLDVCAQDLGTTYPLTKTQLGKMMAGWSPPQGSSWAALGVEASGAMRFGYATIAGNGTEELKEPDEYGGSFTKPASPPLWYQVQATGDLDGDAKMKSYTIVYGSSLSDELGVIQEEGYVEP